jgi:tRNA modification GTPase
MRNDGVIAAIATAWGESAIAVMRLSGAGSLEITDNFFRSKKGKLLSDLPARYMSLGFIRDKTGSTVDEVLAVHFEEGRGYTGEESVEIHCHGGITAVQRCLELFLSGGARIAEPGEFTKRAYLSGRVDLAQAEAVLGVIRSKSDASLMSAERSLQGELSARVRQLMDSLTNARAEIEVRLDYPEEVDGEEYSEISLRLEEISQSAFDLAQRCRVGLILAGGVKVAILGRPNVGKSALLNALTGQQRAIVTKIPGTTRDTVTGATVWRGLALELIDTAGIRETEDEIESIGIARSLDAMNGADIRLVVADSSAGITASETNIILKIIKEGSGEDASKNTLVVLNKCDLPQTAGESYAERARLQPAYRADRADQIKRVNIIKTSALTGFGIADLKDAILALALGSAKAEEGYAATERMASAIAEAASLISDAKTAVMRGTGVDVAGSLLAEASVALSEVLGADATEELLDAIFSNFCVGK